MAALYKVVLHSENLDNPGNEFINIFGYRSNVIVVDEARELNTQFTAQIIPALVEVMSNFTQYIRVEVFNMTDGIEYADNILTSPVQGHVGGDRLPAFVGWGFQYNRAVAGKRHGFKRFSALSELDQDNGVATPSALGRLNTLAGKLFAPVKIALIDTWFPVILERKPTGVFPWTSHAVSSVSYRRVTSQLSRKR